MSAPSPPKPWERNGVIPTSATPAVASSSSVATPAVPTRPSSLTQPTASTSTALTAPTSYNSYTSPYTSAYGSSYASPYNRFGAGGYGGYGGGYGSYGSYGGLGYGGGYGGAGGYSMMGAAGNPFGMQPPIDPITGQPLPSLIQQVESSTSQTFALIQSIVGTFTGFAQMLESTFMATHSSFFAMLGVAEQFAHLRMALGQVFGLFGIVGWLRGWWKGDRRGFRDDFKKFMKGGEGAEGAPRPSRKPLIVFLVMVFGLPYLMNRLIKHVMSRLPPPQPPQQLGPNGQPLPQQVIDPANLTFARALYAFETKDPVELSLSKGELVAVLQQTDPVSGAESEWWQGRTREGRQGWFPRAYVEIVKQKKVDGEVPSGKIVS